MLLVELLLHCRLEIAEVNLQRLNRLLRQLLLVLQLLVQPLILLLIRGHFHKMSAQKGGGFTKRYEARFL